MYKILAKLSFGASNLHYLPSCHSTNEVAQNLVRTGSREGTVVITNDQFDGKGQTGNSWQAAPGQNLTFSLVLRPSFLDPNEQFFITMAVSLALKAVLEAYLPGEIKVKWPNDIYYKEKKIAGMLIENVLRGSSFEACIIGIGLNVNQDSFPELPRATSMKAVSGKRYELNSLLNELMVQIDQLYVMLKEDERQNLRDQYHEALLGRGKERQFKVGDKEITAVIQATDAAGRLIVWSPEQTYRFAHKEVEMLF